MKKLRILMVTLCVAVFLCGFSVTAYAGGGPEWEGLDPAEETTTPEPTVEPGEGFTAVGNLVTRDLLYPYRPPAPGFYCGDNNQSGL